MATNKTGSMSIKTSLLQDMLARSVKGVGNIDPLSFTEMIAIQLKDNKLTLITSDSINYLYIEEDHVDGDDFYIVINVDKFAKLISKTTSPTVRLKVVEDYLLVECNGNYKVDIPLEEDGSTIRYPDPLSELNSDPELTAELQLSTVKTILSTSKSAVATQEEAESNGLCYGGYYIGDKIVTTNNSKICGLNVSVTDKPILVSADTMNLLSVINAEKIGVNVYSDGVIVFMTPDCTIYSRLMDGIEDFAIDDISELLSVDVPSLCKVSKNNLLSTLDRLSLFVTVYDDKKVHLTFTKDGINIDTESRKSNGAEIIDYAESKDYKPFTCHVVISMLIQVIKSIRSDVVTICYGEERFLKFVDDSVVYLLALEQSDTDEEDDSELPFN